MLSPSVGTLKGKHLEQVKAFLTLLPNVVTRFALKVGERQYDDCWVRTVASTHIVFAQGKSLSVGDKSSSSPN